MISFSSTPWNGEFRGKLLLLLLMPMLEKRRRKEKRREDCEEDPQFVLFFLQHFCFVQDCSVLFLVQGKKEKASFF
jgi:hypothetical protein